MLADDALVASHRLSEWCSRAPDLEEDIALANVALDLLGQARLLLARPRRRGRPLRRPRPARGLPSAAGGRTGVLPRGRRLPQRAADRGRQRGLRAHDRAAARALLRAPRPLPAARHQPRHRARRGRRQGRQGAGLPPRLRRPLVPHPGPGHRRVAPPAALRTGRDLAAVRRALRHPPRRAGRRRCRRRGGPRDHGGRGRRGARAGLRDERRRPSRPGTAGGGAGPHRPRRPAHTRR